MTVLQQKLHERKVGDQSRQSTPCSATTPAAEDETSRELETADLRRYSAIEARDSAQRSSPSPTRRRQSLTPAEDA